MNLNNGDNMNKGKRERGGWKRVIEQGLERRGSEGLGQETEGRKEVEKGTERVKEGEKGIAK